MTTHSTEISFLLDRSGSMSSCLEPTIRAFNSFLHEQQKLPDLARMTLIQFDDQYEVHAASVPIQEMTELTTKTYEPRGATALLDAMGRMIDELEARIQALPAEKRPSAVIVAILTDGYENSSTKFTWKDVSERISRLRESQNWQFLFLGADADAVAQADRLNILSQNVAQYVKSGPGMETAACALNRKVRALRKQATGQHLAESDSLDANAALRDLVEEEKRKNSKKKK